MPWPRRKLVHLLDSGEILGGSGPPIEPPIEEFEGIGVWYKADRGAWTNTAARFLVANDETLSVVGPSSLQISPTSAFTWGGWIWCDDSPIANVMGAFAPGGALLWRLYTETTPRIRASVSGFSYVEAHGPAWTLNAWHFVVCTFNPAAGGGLVSISVDGAGPSQGFNVGQVASMGAGGMFILGGQSVSGVPAGGFNGRMQGWFVYGRELNATEQSFLWNAGNGRRYDELTTALKTELRGWWPLTEQSGSRRDMSGNNVALTDNNTVLSAAGKYYEQAGSDGTPIEVWDDSGPNDFMLGQVAAANRPTLQWSERNGLPVVRFDGTDDYLSTNLILGSFLSGPTNQTVFIVQMQHTADLASTTYNWDPAGTGANMLGAHLKYTDNVLYYDTGPATGLGRLIATAPEPWRGTWHIVEMVRDGSTTNSSFTIEGNPVSTYTAQPTAAFNPAQSANLLMAEHGGGLGPNIFQGDIAEFIIFNRTLTLAERTTVRNYLKNKWGISSDKLLVNTARTGYVLANSTTNDRVAVTM